MQVLPVPADQTTELHREMEFRAGGKELLTEHGIYFDGQDGLAGREWGTRGLLQAMVAEVTQKAAAWPPDLRKI